MEPDVIKVNSPDLMEAFLSLPVKVYGKRSVPLAAAPLLTRNRFNPSTNPSLEHIQFANFIAVEGKETVGRITASVDHLNERREEGFWGCFECVRNDRKVAGALLKAAADWLKEQGKTVMTGPATLNTMQQVGLLIDGFDQEVQKDLPYNPSFYRELIENAGQEKFHDLQCFKWELPHTLPPELEGVQHSSDLVIRSVNYQEISKEAKILKEINNEALFEIWGFIPMTEAEARGFIESLAFDVPSELFIIIEVEKQPAGIFLSIPYKSPEGGTGGKIRLAVGGLKPEFRGRKIAFPVIKEFYNRCKKWGFTEGEASQVAEGNNPVKEKIITPLFGGEVTRLYRVYRQKLT